MRAVLFCAFLCNLACSSVSLFWHALVRTCCRSTWDVVCMCMLACIGYAVWGILHAHRSCVCLHFAATMHEFCRIFDKHYACKRHANCVLYCSVPFACSLACGSVRIWLRALVRTRCLSFWDFVCACILHALVVYFCSYFVPCMHMACKMRSCLYLHFECLLFCMHWLYILRHTSCIHKAKCVVAFACFLHAYASILQHFWETLRMQKARNTRAAVVKLLFCAVWHAVLCGFGCVHWLGHVAFLFGICMLVYFACIGCAFLLILRAVHAHGMQNAFLSLLAF